jgi:secreted PhoX family phosphatase
MLLDRREFLRIGAGTTLVGAALLALPDVTGALAGGPITRSGDGPYGPLGSPDELGFRLPEGFRARELARGNEAVAGTDYPWHVFPDGGATFPVRRGEWIYVSNSEAPGTSGGASALRFSADGDVVDAYRILEGTGSNCAGGATPWGTWLSGEEHGAGQLWECDPRGRRPGVARAAMGRFEHEAAAVDPQRRHVYLTEDDSDGRFYRFTPRRWPDLDAGTLEVAVVADNGRVRWREVPDPGAEAVPTREQVPESTGFDGGEGIVFDRGVVFFSTKGDNKVWAYDARRARIEVLYDGDARAELPLRGVDNLGVTPRGDLVVAEDGDDMQLVVLTRSGVAAPLLQLTGQEGSELAGPAFSPDGRHLYFSSQRGGGGPGITYEVSGPFRRRR